MLKISILFLLAGCLDTAITDASAGAIDVGVTYQCDLVVEFHGPAPTYPYAEVHDFETCLERGTGESFVNAWTDDVCLPELRAALGGRCVGDGCWIKGQLDFCTPGAYPWESP